MEILNVKERPTVRLLFVYMHKKSIFLFYEVLKVIFVSKVLTVISSLGFYLEIVNFNEALTLNSRPGLEF